MIFTDLKSSLVRLEEQLHNRRDFNESYAAINITLNNEDNVFSSTPIISNSNNITYSISLKSNSSLQENATTDEFNILPQCSGISTINSSQHESNTDLSYNPTSYHDTTATTTTETTSIIEKSSLIEKSPFNKGPPLDIRNLDVPASNEKVSKRHFCPFCNELQTKFARHLQLKHKKEEDVKKFMCLPPRDKLRVKMIDKIRKKGDFIHNTVPELNSGILITTRQRQMKSKNKTVEDYAVCKTCQGTFSKTTIRFHVKKCNTSRNKNTRDILSSGRRLTGYIHSCAIDKLRRDIFPVMRDDDVSRCIRYDELLIKFANKLCEKYTLVHQYDMIRAHLRVLGRLKIAIMDHDKSIETFKDVFKPQKYDLVIKCLRIVSNWDANSMTFKTPAVAQNLTTLIKKCANKLKIECIKTQDLERKREVEEFLSLWLEEVPTDINKKALEDQICNKRKKKVVLPSKEDIRLLYQYLKNECRTCLAILKDEGFNIDAWLNLTKCTLIFVQIFNRRRAGEIERLTIADFNTNQGLDENIDKDIYQKLSESMKKYTQQFVRLAIRGKKNRTVPVLLCPLAKECIEIIIKFRHHAGIQSTNEYIFATVNTNKMSKKYLRACPLIRQFSNDCNAVMPSTLRGTMLRKHIATYTSLLELEECQIDRLANFLGHEKDIHKTIYRQPIPVAEITHVSKLLMGAIGNAEDEDDSGEDQNSDSSSDEEIGGNSTRPSTSRPKNKAERTDLVSNPQIFGKIVDRNNYRCKYHYLFLST